MEKYIINADTLAIIPLEELKSRVIEKDDEFIIDDTVLNIVNNSCLFFGSSLKGRVEGTKYLLNYAYKLPIIIDNLNRLIFFPTLSYDSAECIWLSLKNIDKYEKSDKNTKIYFVGGKTDKIRVTVSSFENQFFRSLRLEKILTKKGQ